MEIPRKTAEKKALQYEQQGLYLYIYNN